MVNWAGLPFNSVSIAAAVLLQVVCTDDDDTMLDACSLGFSLHSFSSYWPNAYSLWPGICNCWHSV